MKQRICYIHVGTHKTGTTSIQAFLRDNERRLAACGVHVVRAGRGEDAAGHHNLTQELLGYAGFVPERGGLAEIGEELRRSGSRRAVISSEDFSLASRSPELLVRVRDVIAEAGFTTMIVIYMRPQIPYCVAIYAEIVKNGNRKPFAVYLDEIARYGSFEWNGAIGPLCRYDVLLDRFASVFGKQAVIVRRYRSGARKNALLRGFAELVIGGRASFDEFSFPPERFNPSLSFPRVLRALGSNADVIDMRFAPLSLQQLFEVAGLFWLPNAEIALRYRTWVPPFELKDVFLALPLRRSFARTASLLSARRALTRSLPAAGKITMHIDGPVAREL